MKTVDDLIKYDFEYAGTISVDLDGEVTYEIVNPKFKEHDEQVYAWAINDQVVYIGMASKGIYKRLSEHRGGWRGGSTTGVRKAELIKEQSNLGDNIKVYGRKCESIEQSVNILGIDKTIKFSLITQEENMLIELFQPAWNVVGK